MGYESTDKELEQLRKAKEKEHRLAEVGPARLPAPPAPSLIQKSIKFINPAVNKSVPFPQYCPLCRSSLEERINLLEVDAKIVPTLMQSIGSEFLVHQDGKFFITALKCPDCKRAFIIGVGYETVMKPVVTPNGFNPRKVDTG